MRILVILIIWWHHKTKYIGSLTKLRLLSRAGCESTESRVILLLPSAGLPPLCHIIHTKHWPLYANHKTLKHPSIVLLCIVLYKEVVELLRTQLTAVAVSAMYHWWLSDTPDVWLPPQCPHKGESAAVIFLQTFPLTQTSFSLSPTTLHCPASGS